VHFGVIRKITFAVALRLASRSPQRALEPVSRRWGGNVAVEVRFASFLLPFGDNIPKA
jgi:hypothetical protein